MSEMRMTRRSAAAAAFTILPRHVLGGQAGKAPSDKLNIAGVGVGGMGANYLRNCETENIAALCDVDGLVAAKTFARYPGARTYRDFRVMLEKEKGIDAVVIGTPDHSHAFVALAAMQMGRHVYCAKPLTRTVQEARALARAAAEHRVATQMSVQSCASEGACATAEWLAAGAVGNVREVHVWSDRPIWPQGLARPSEAFPVPATLDWDLWLGPAAARPYHPIYHPFRWRGWYDFGTGALGDMACHSLHVFHRVLKLGQPKAVQASCTVPAEPVMERAAGKVVIKTRRTRQPETFPMSSVVVWDFPGLRLFWYDGGLKPPRPAELDPARVMGISGILFTGDKGVMLSGFSGGPQFTSNRAFTTPAKTLPRTRGHYQEWIAAAKGGPPANCHFGFGSRLTELALLGVIAQRTGKYLEWDGAEMRFTNDAEASALLTGTYRPGWGL